jgi:hypothetical protein
MLEVRTATANGTSERDHAVAEPWTRRPLRARREDLRFWTVSSAAGKLFCSLAGDGG